MPQTQKTLSQKDLNRLVRQVNTTHQPVILAGQDRTAEAVLMSREDFETAQAIIQAATGRPANFLTA